MDTLTAVVEKCRDTGLFVGYKPGIAGAHSQGSTLEELNENLKEVVDMLNGGRDLWQLQDLDIDFRVRPEADFDYLKFIKTLRLKVL